MLGSDMVMDPGTGWCSYGARTTPIATDWPSSSGTPAMCRNPFGTAVADNRPDLLTLASTRWDQNAENIRQVYRVIIKTETWNIRTTDQKA